MNFGHVEDVPHSQTSVVCLEFFSRMCASIGIEARAYDHLELVFRINAHHDIACVQKNVLMCRLLPAASS